MPFVTATDKTEIFYKDWGKGKPVILIHGWPVNADMWEHQAIALASAGYRVISYDRRGFGRSGQPWSGYDYDTMAGDLNSLMESLDLRDAALIGFSMGGGEVARYLSRYSAQRVSKAVLVSAVTPFMLKTQDNPEGVDPAVFQQIIDGLTADRPKFLAGFGKGFFGVGLLSHPVSDEALAWAQNLALMASPKATLDCVVAFSATDFRPDMKAFTIPTLVIHGTSDATVPIEVSGRRAAALIPGATLIEYDGEPHGLFITAKDRLSQDLIRFLVG